jgi:hypothetical protein
MDWSAVGSLVGPMAPMIGQLLGGFIPFPGGAILGQMAGKVVAEALGVPPTPEAVQKAIVEGDQTVVADKLSAAETKMQAQVEMLKAGLADVQDARANELKLVQSGSLIAWGPVIISTLVVVGFIGCVMGLMFIKVNLSDTGGQAYLILTGVLSQAFAQVTGYWLGSSAGSVDKSAQIAALAGIRTDTSPSKAVTAAAAAKPIAPHR